MEEKEVILLNNDRVNQAKDSLKFALESLQQIIKEEQSNCKHETLAECDYNERFGTAEPPMRVCLDCGISEVGWGCGFIILTTARPHGLIYKIGRDELFRVRQGIVIREDHKSKLLRSESTLQQLINEN